MEIPITCQPIIQLHFTLLNPVLWIWIRINVITVFLTGATLRIALVVPLQFGDHTDGNIGHNHKPVGAQTKMIIWDFQPWI